MLSALAGFVVGYVLRSTFLSRTRAFLTLTAWLSILAMFLMVFVTVYHVFIRPKSELFTDVLWAECILTGIVTAYFAIRS